MEQKLDENLYSRQLYVLGTDSMAAFLKSHVLIVGLDGLGQEIAKNVILAGINKVTLYDPSLVTIQSLSSGFYFTYETINQRKDNSVLAKMKELNPYVSVDVLTSDLEPHSDKFIECLNSSSYTLIVLTNYDYELLKKIKNHKLVSCQVNGLVSHVFCDFKQGFVVSDQNGEPAITGIFNDVTTTGELTMLENTRHNLNDDSAIRIYTNNGENYQEYRVKTLTPFKLQLLDYKGDLIFGGSFEETKVPLKIDFKDIEKAIIEPDILNDCEMSQILHNCYILYNDKFSCKPDNFITHYKDNILNLPYKLFSSGLIKLFVYMHDIDLMPMASVIGGFVAQEVLKGCSGKFTPLKQFMYYDALECLRKEQAVPLDTIDRGEYKEIIYKFIEKHVENIDFDFKLESRYYSYEKMFGKTAFDNFKKASGFIVGAGAIGCEHLKNIVMSGITLDSKLYLADMDSIELSNLNRQFLFRQRHVGKMKSKVALKQIKHLNQDYESVTGEYKNELHSFVEAVGSETESIFSDKFYQSLTFVANALDNIEGRRYVDGRIILNKKPLFESGTLGAKGNTQVIIPDKTESYSSSNDPAEQSIPLCTLKNYPYLIEHTIEFAKAEFDESFQSKIINIKKYFENSEKDDDLQVDVKDIIDDLPTKVEDCIQIAFDLFYRLFYSDIKKLLIAFPADHVTEQGILFWSSPKRPPVPIEFDSNNETHLLFIISAANLYKSTFTVEGEVNVEEIVHYFKQNRDIVYEKAKKKITPPMDSIEDSVVEKNKEPFQAVSELILDYGKQNIDKFCPIEFEKDDDSNHHVDFVFACANIRAQNYKINEASRLKVKGIAGRIIPAIATTTALISGLSVLEIYKYILGCDMSAYRNTYLSLALPLITSSDPLPAMQEEYYFNPEAKFTFTLWDRIEFKDMTLQEFFDICNSKYKVKVDMLTVDSKTIWMTFSNTAKKYEKYKKMKFSEIVNHVEGRKYIVLGVMFECECENFPYVVINLED